MKPLLVLILNLLIINFYAQEMKVITTDKTQLQLTVLDTAAKNQLLQHFTGKQDNTLRKKWTARTFVLSDNQILVEFYDRQAALIYSLEDLQKD